MYLKKPEMTKEESEFNFGVVDNYIIYYLVTVTLKL